MTETAPACCIIIPVYRHVRPLLNVLRQLRPLGLHCFLVDDGNEPALKNSLQSDLTESSWIDVLRLSVHSGKGAACVEGSRAAFARGFSHAIFMDADGQHHVPDIPRILDLLKQYPNAMIMGKPVFDQSAPLKRRFGRIVSNVWVWIETLSFDIQDSLCGFRCLPLGPLLKVAPDMRLDRSMDFDPNIAVRLFWEALPVINFNTPVHYPEDGISNFHLLRDNLALVRLHTGLVFGMLWRSPSLLSRHWKRA